MNKTTPEPVDHSDYLIAKIKDEVPFISIETFDEQGNLTRMDWREMTMDEFEERVGCISRTAP